MMRHLAFVVVLATYLVAFTYTPKGVTHFNMLHVLDQIPPTAAARDRAIIEFTDADGNRDVVIWIDATKSLSVINAATGTTLATTTTTTSTTTTTTTT